MENQTQAGIHRTYFSSPSALAKKLYYTVPYAGHFYCDRNYHTKRENFDSLLILHVLSGTFTYVHEDGRHITAGEGQTVILNCYVPHEYYTRDTLEFLWVHVAGANCQAFYEEIRRITGDVVGARNVETVKRQLFRCFEGVRDGWSEADLSREAYSLLLALLNPDPGQQSKGDGLYAVREFISDHLDGELTVPLLAQQAHMSPSHFTRLFRKQTGTSPYEYVLTARLNKAKEYLYETDLSVAQIAYATGFNSEANFIFRFTSRVGISPGKFRKLRF